MGTIIVYLCIAIKQNLKTLYKMSIAKQISEITKEIDSLKISLDLPKNELQYSENRRKLIQLKAEKRKLKRTL